MTDLYKDLAQQFIDRKSIIIYAPRDRDYLTFEEIVSSIEDILPADWEGVLHADSAFPNAVGAGDYHGGHLRIASDLNHVETEHWDILVTTEPYWNLIKSETGFSDMLTKLEWGPRVVLLPKNWK